MTADIYRRCHAPSHFKQIRIEVEDDYLLGILTKIGSLRGLMALAK